MEKLERLFINLHMIDESFEQKLFDQEMHDYIEALDTRRDKYVSLIKEELKNHPVYLKRFNFLYRPPNGDYMLNLHEITQFIKTEIWKQRKKNGQY